MNVYRAFLAALFLLCIAPPCWGEGPAPHDSAVVPTVTPVETAPVSDDGGPIQDNSFLVEEAYNQERGVVQHINTFMRMANSHDWAYTFTQEWPWNPHPRHQFSYTVAATSLGEFGRAGFGDMMFNWRYQLIGSGETRLAFAPRLSAVLPTGDSRFGRGAGGAGLQTNLPLSVALSRHFVAHTNTGFTVVPRAQDSVGDHASTFGYNFGQSLIWLAHPRVNFMLETAYSAFDSVVAPNRTDRDQTFYVSPGVRWAHNFKNGLQIVPGVAVPLGVGPSSGERGLYFYLSFEHPFVHGLKPPR